VSAEALDAAPLAVARPDAAPYHDARHSMTCAAALAARKEASATQIGNRSKGLLNFLDDQLRERDEVRSVLRQVFGNVAATRAAGPAGPGRAAVLRRSAAAAAAACSPGAAGPCICSA
jgi:hypothetical protein